MAERLGDAVLELRTDDAAFTRGIRKAEAQVKRLGRAFDDVGRKAQRIGRQLATFVTLPIIAIGVASVKTASDIQEMQNLFAVTFGSAADDVEEWAKRTAKATNRSRFELQRTAADFAAFLKPLGVAPDAIEPMSTALTQLVTDIASFRNQTDQEVFTRLFSGLAGETEAVRRLGIDIGEAAIKQELLNQGFKGTAAEATQGVKAMARFALIMRQTTDAQGDAARTSESFENQTKALGATITDVRVEIGQRLLPVATRLVQRIRELGVRFLALSGNVKSGTVAVVGLIAVVGPLIFALGLVTRAIGFAIGGLAFLGPAIRGTFLIIRTSIFAVQLAVVGFLAFFSTVPGIIIISLAALVGGFFIFRDTIVGFFKGLVLAIKDAFIDGFNNKVVIPFQEAINKLVSFLPDSVIETLGLKALEINDVIESSFADDMKQVIAEAAENGKRELESFKATAIAAVGIVKTKFGEMGDAISDFLPDLDLADFSLENIGSQFDELMARFATLNTAQGGVAGAAADAADDAANSWEDFGKTIRDTVEDNMTRAITNFREFGDAARSILNAVFEGLVRLAIVKPFLAFLGVPSFVHGGRPPLNRPSIVGERGPELFIPDRAGTVIPNNQLGDMGGISQEFNFPLAFPTQLEAFVRNVAGPAGRDAAVQVLRARQGRF